MRVMVINDIVRVILSVVGVFGRTSSGSSSSCILYCSSNVYRSRFFFSTIEMN